MKSMPKPYFYLAAKAKLHMANFYFHMKPSNML